MDKQTALVSSFIFVFDFYCCEYRLCIIRDKFLRRARNFSRASTTRCPGYSSYAGNTRYRHDERNTVCRYPPIHIFSVSLRDL